jgi:hypothetical protein
MNGNKNNTASVLVQVSRMMMIRVKCTGIFKILLIQLVSKESRCGEMADAVDSKSTGIKPVSVQVRPSVYLFHLQTTLIALYHGDVLDLTGRMICTGCGSERCSPLTTSKINLNGNNVVSHLNFGSARVAQAA